MDLGAREIVDWNGAEWGTSGAGTAVEIVASALAERPPLQLMSSKTPVCRNSPSTRRPERELREGKRERKMGLKKAWIWARGGHAWPC